MMATIRIATARASSQWVRRAVTRLPLLASSRFHSAGSSTIINNNSSIRSCGIGSATAISGVSKRATVSPVAFAQPIAPSPNRRPYSTLTPPIGLIGGNHSISSFGSSPVLAQSHERNRRRLQTKQATATTHHSFSTAPLIEDDVPSASSKKPSRRRAAGLLEEKNPIVLTDRAALRIQELLDGAKQNNNDADILGLRLGVKRRGCNGLSYTLNYATADTIGKDILMESHNIKVYIEPMALFNVVGTVMDWEESEMSSEFTFQNPNSKGECGCGESFNV